MGEQAMVDLHRSRSQPQVLPSSSPCQVLAGPSDCLRAAVRGTLLRHHPLTPRQLEVFELLAEGKGPQEIAAELCLSPRSVEDYIHDLHTALGTGHRAQLVALWLSLVYEIVDTLGLALPLHPLNEHRLMAAGPARSTGKEP